MSSIEQFVDGAIVVMRVGVPPSNKVLSYDPETLVAEGKDAVDPRSLWQVSVVQTNPLHVRLKAPGHAPWPGPDGPMDWYLNGEQATGDQASVVSLVVDNSTNTVWEVTQFMNTDDVTLSCAPFGIPPNHSIGPLAYDPSAGKIVLGTDWNLWAVTLP